LGKLTRDEFKEVIKQIRKIDEAREKRNIEENWRADRKLTLACLGLMATMLLVAAIAHYAVIGLFAIFPLVIVINGWQSWHRVMLGICENERRRVELRRLADRA
jgi:CHASE3 domain sensor protein